MPEELKIIIEADVSQAQAALNGIQDTASKTATSLKNVAPAANAGLASTAQQAKVVTLAVSNLGRTLDDLKQKVAGKQALISTERDVANIIVLNKEIQALEAEIVRVQNIGKVGFNEFGRAVSDSSDKIVAGFGNAFGAIRRLAFILPGIGIAGLFDAAFTGFSKLVDAIGSSNFGVPKFKELINSVEGAKDEFVKASVAVETLKDEIQLAKDGFIQKDAVVKKYNETIGKTTGIVSSLDQAERELNKNADAYIQFTLLKAAANVALGKSADLAFQAALQNQKDLERISKISADKEGIGEFIKSGEDNLRKAEQDSFGKRVTSLKDIANNFLKEAAEIKKTFNFNFFDDTKKETAIKGLDEVQKKLIDVAKVLSENFRVPIDLRFAVGDTSLEEFEKAKKILKGIEDHTIRIKFISLTEDIAKVQQGLQDIKIPKLAPRIDEIGFKQEFNDLVRGFTVPLKILLDQPSLLQTEDQLKQIFSGFSDTNIFTEFGRQAGTKFRDALLKSVQDLQKGFTINPDIDTTDIINSLTSSLAGIKDIQLKVIKGEDFNSAIRTLRDLHDTGVAAGEAVEKAFLAAGRSSEDAARAGKAITTFFGGITKQTDDIAQALNNTLAPAFSNLFDAILTGKNPVKAFFESIGKSIEDLASKLIGAEIEKAILSIIGVSSTATSAIQATTLATEAAAASGAAAAATAAAAAAGAAAAATAASAAATAAVIAAAAAKAASAAINPLSLLGFLGLGFAEGGRPPVGETVMVGERGPELMKFDRPGTIYSHSDTVSMLSTASVKQHESIKEYFAEARVLQQLKTHFTELIRPIQATVNNISSTHEKISSFSYKLHENVKYLKESFVSSVATNNNSEVNNVSSIVTDSISKSIDRIKESFASSLITNKEVNNNDSSVSNSIEKLQKALSTVNNSKVSNSDTLREATQILKESLSSEVNSNTSSLINKAVEKIAESLVISNTDVSKSTQQNDISSLITRSIEHLKESSNKFSSVKYSIEKLQSFDKSEKSVTIERIINNNFFTESISSSFKSMSLERLQKMFNIPAFATGGAVFGPTLAILGEGFGISRSNPEFVGTANQLQNVTGGQFDLNLTLNGSLETTGDKLWTFLNRTSKTHLRTTGKKPL